MSRAIRVTQGDLTSGDSLLLVNASNTNVALGTGVSGAIRRACGRGYQEHLEQALRARFGGPMEPGQVLVTDAGTHPKARFVAHVAVMDYRDGFTGSSFPTAQTIERGCRNLWTAIEELRQGPVSIAMVALGAGTGNLGVRKPTELACATLKAHLEATPGSRIGHVTFYGYEFHEYVSMVGVVRGFFALPEGSIPADVLAMADALNGRS